MADAEAGAKEVFRRSTMNRISSADELDHYIKVTNPSAWVVVVAALLLIAGIVVWAVVAIVPVTVNATGFTIKAPESGKTLVICYVDKSTADKIRESGAKATVGNVEATAVSVAPTPLSSAEIAKALDTDFYLDALHLSDWNYEVTIEPAAEPDRGNYTVMSAYGELGLVPVSITVSEKRPINIVLGKK